MSAVSFAFKSFDTFSGGPITGAIASCAGCKEAAAGGGLATDAVGVSLEEPIEPNKELAVSQPANPTASQPAHSAIAIGFIFCLAAAASKVVTATLPR
jgi:hypothetical protein